MDSFNLFFFKGKSPDWAVEAKHEIGTLEESGLGIVRLTWRYLATVRRAKIDWLGDKKPRDSHLLPLQQLWLCHRAVGHGEWFLPLLLLESRNAVREPWGCQEGRIMPSSFFPRIFTQGSPITLPPGADPVVCQTTSISACRRNRSAFLSFPPRERHHLQECLQRDRIPPSPQQQPRFSPPSSKTGLEKTFSQSQISDQSWLLR